MLRAHLPTPGPTSTQLRKALSSLRRHSFVLAREPSVSSSTQRSNRARTSSSKSSSSGLAESCASASTTSEPRGTRPRRRRRGGVLCRLDVEQDLLLATVTVQLEALPPVLLRGGLRGDLSWHLRQMATIPERRGQGIGSELLAAVLDHVRSHDGGVIWCSARVAAIPFYERGGFSPGWISASRGGYWTTPHDVPGPWDVGGAALGQSLRRASAMPSSWARPNSP